MDVMSVKAIPLALPDLSQNIYIFNRISVDGTCMYNTLLLFLFHFIPFWLEIYWTSTFNQCCIIIKFIDI